MTVERGLYASVSIDATRWHMELPVGDNRPCEQCKQPCAFIEYSFECPLHPGVCSDAMWNEYLEELNKVISW